MKMRLEIAGEKTIDVKDNETVYSALKRNGIYLVAPCGGKGTCGKCRVKVLEGRFDCKSYGKLDRKERAGGIVLSCQSTLQTDIKIEIPKQSKLVLGGKIAVSAFEDTAAYLKSYGVDVSPLVKRVFLELPPPSINDNISDLERLKRAMAEHGFTHVHFSYELVAGILESLRNADWNVFLSYINSGEASTEALSLLQAGECNHSYGLAIDIGTTTVVVYLVDLISGNVIDIGST
ncbi:MAG: 2Fe-2S iron-sulfur cluster binding domain-containing protein, partial [Nitrospirae bacterium]|nr:2Fe-2S iron-sulfur cluster binding domain-containing protein [Nitrospirota bacterium]